MRVPVAPSTIAALAAYESQRDQIWPAAARLFVSLAGKIVAYRYFGETFSGAVDSAGIGAGSGITAASTRPSAQLRGTDTARLAPGRPGRRGALAPAVDLPWAPRATLHYRYLTATPELLALAAARLEAAQAVAP